MSLLSHLISCYFFLHFAKNDTTATTAAIIIMYNSIQGTVFFKSLLSTQTCLLKKKRWHFRQLVTMLSKGSRTVNEISTVNVKSVFLCLAFFEPSFLLLLLLLQTDFWLNKLVEILHFVQLPIVQKAQLRMTIESIFFK